MHTVGREDDQFLKLTSRTSFVYIATSFS